MIMMTLNFQLHKYQLQHNGPEVKCAILVCQLFHPYSLCFLGDCPLTAIIKVILALSDKFCVKLLRKADNILFQEDMFDIILYRVGRIWFELLSSSPSQNRPAQLVELPRSDFDPELFPHSAYFKFFVTFATKVPYLTFCNKM